MSSQFVKRHGVLAGPNKGAYMLFMSVQTKSAEEDVVRDKTVQNGGVGIRRQSQTPILFQEPTKAKK